MSEFIVYKFLKKNPRNAFSYKIIYKKTKVPNIHRKLRQLKKRRMIKRTNIIMNNKTIKKLNIKIKSKKPKRNSESGFWHIKPFMEVDKIVY